MFFLSEMDVTLELARLRGRLTRTLEQRRLLSMVWQSQNQNSVGVAVAAWNMWIWEQSAEVALRVGARALIYGMARSHRRRCTWAAHEEAAGGAREWHGREEEGRKVGRDVNGSSTCIIDIIFMDIKYSGSDRYRHHKYKFVIDIDIIKCNFWTFGYGSIMDIKYSGSDMNR